MKTIYVVMLAAGLYEDRSTKVVRAFTDESDANSFVSRKNTALSELNGLLRAYDLLVADWEKSHPTPELDSSIYDHWDNQRREEERRLESVLGIDVAHKELGLTYHSTDEAQYYITPTSLDSDD